MARDRLREKLVDYLTKALFSSDMRVPFLRWSINKEAFFKRLVAPQPPPA